MLQLDMIGRNEERPADAADQIEEEKPKKTLTLLALPVRPSALILKS
jgi:hypothetical protein